MEVMCEEVYRTSVISIDSYENRILVGRIFNPCLENEISFRSTIEFIKEMEKLMEALNCPQAFSEKREFSPVRESVSRYTAPCDINVRKGRCATFNLRIMFRQNASWQGSLVWLKNGREKNFRSVLELLLLMDSALDCMTE